MFPLIAVDIGNNRIKLGRFNLLPAAGIPQPHDTLQIDGHDVQLERIAEWLGELPRPACWWIGSVNRPTAGRLLEWLRQNAGQDQIRLLAAADLPLEVRLPRPDMVGIDRLLDAVAANRYRQPGRPALIVDMGTAITVDLVSGDGAFCGGAIAAGMATAARALHAFTDLLPQLDVARLEVPPALGKATIEAMQSGLFWGTLGSIRELIRQLSAPLPAVPQVFLTGGAGPAFAERLGTDAAYLPHLTLTGIALAAAAARRG